MTTRGLPHPLRSLFSLLLERTSKWTTLKSLKYRMKDKRSKDFLRFITSISRKFYNAFIITVFFFILSEVRQFDGIVLAATECQNYDFIESSALGALAIPFLRLDFSACPADAGWNTERLELYRLHVTFFGS